MNSLHGPVGPWHRVLITPAILDGQPWTARAIRNSCLRRHCHQLGRTFRKGNRELEPLRLACRRLFVVLEARSRVLMELHPKQWPIVAMVARIAAYQPQWLHAPEEWCPVTEATAQEQWASLLSHLFQRFTVPGCLDAAWQVRGALQHLERDCYCAAAAGSSVRTVPGFPVSVSHRTLHVALHDCNEPTVARAVWRAELKGFGASDYLQSLVMESRVVRELTNHAFWTRLVARFARGSTDDASDFGFVADALAMAVAQGGLSRGEQLLRLPMQELRRFSLRLWSDLLKANEDCFEARDLYRAQAREALRSISMKTWSRMLPYDWFITVRDASSCVEWRMQELCSQGALIAEGREMQHCVARYAGSCRGGRSAIFSLRSRNLLQHDSVETRLATLQVCVKTRRVIQVRGQRDSRPSARSWELIKDWANDHELRA